MATNKDILVNSFNATDFKRFNRNDRRILKFLIEQGASSVGEIAVATGVHRQKIQQRILALRRRRLIILATKNHVTYFRLNLERSSYDR